MDAYLSLANGRLTMSARLSPDAALRMIPELAASRWRWQALPGGLTNRNYKVDCADRCFVLRLDDTHTAGFGLDRVTEIKARKLACEAGLAAQVVFADIERGILLSEYLAGEVWREEDLQHPRNLESLAELLRKVHALPSLGECFNRNQVAKRYADQLAGRPDLYSFGQACQRLVADSPVGEFVCCCHNDVIAENVVAASQLKLLDWEYACDNDPMFDLASLIAFHNLDTKWSDILLNAYAGGADASLRERLEGQIRLYDAIQWLWFAVKQSTRPDSRQSVHLQRLRQRIECGIR